MGGAASAITDAANLLIGPMVACQGAVVSGPLKL